MNFPDGQNDLKFGDIATSDMPRQDLDSLQRIDSVSSYEAENPQKSTLKGLLYGFGAATSYGLLICAVKYLFQFSSVTVFEILYLRSLTALIIVFFILQHQGISLFEVKRHVGFYLAIRCITGFFGFAVEFFSIKFTDLSKIVIILYNPFLTSIMSYILIGEKVNKHDLLSFFFGVIGIGLLTDPFAKIKDQNDIIGIALAFLSAVIFNIGFIALRRVKSELNSWQIVIYFTLTNMFFSPFFFVIEKTFTHQKRGVFEFDSFSLLIIFFVGIITVVGNFCVNKTLFHEKAARATAYYNMELLYTFIFDIFVMKSNFSAAELSGVLCQTPTAERILANVDQTTPPNGKDITDIQFDVDLLQVEGIIENKMHVSLKLVEFTTWVDKRLAYQNNTNVPAYIRNSRLDISEYRYNIWRPNLGYTELNKLVNLTETVFLYPNGTITNYRKILLTLTCQFDYKNSPGNLQQCITTTYIQNEFSDTATLTWMNKFDEERSKDYLSWTLALSKFQNVDVRWKTEPTGVSSGVEIELQFSKTQTFFQKIFIIPSIILVVLAYITFWIDPKRAPARVIFVHFELRIIINTTSFLASTTTKIPQVAEETWQNSFFIWNLVFTVVPIVQYAILNASIKYFEETTKKTEILYQELQAIAEKLDNPMEPELILADSRKLIAKSLRQRILGGDFLQIEGFQINMKEINKKYQTSEDKVRKATTAVQNSQSPFCPCLQQKQKKVSPRKDSSPQRRTSNQAITPVTEIDVDKMPSDPIKLLMFAINRRNRPDGRRNKESLKIIESLGEFSRFHAINIDIQLRLRKIIRSENSTIFGLSEIVSYNFDTVFRYLYPCAFILLMAVMYLTQLPENNAYSFLAAAISATLILICALVISIIIYRKDASNLSTMKAIKFYFMCHCFHSRKVLENYD
ncbi:gamma-aminobutyric acid receptor subunit rho-3-like [Stylonychia lemnae]|uniref:Gamma-aminobutyric acid receptor subunit rho-3-like n=1 Tax=Stylonychia lemnae TaxID=5949 RepID=A0A078AI05_STYLE|nr:gamma-aminobutyric acid receptor subunit rho-3-like [Stylonychia lemnae]|eukprot:CDW81147.1 gamma-aminobutyric acid receptor subunit rho-3-like [Stylonychia lemnae]